MQRFAKAIAVAVSLTITTVFDEFAGVRWLSLVTIAILAVWMYAAVYAGRRFRELSEEPEPSA